ncbi:MAG TPA: serine-type D-Ala-D-Ala carboxypeptidase [Gammaproteobacteria bacterium]|nr:serine-type D-Ala-D-Ala carboxypeptidase [Gammaproteobacteria bacterium]
MLIRFLAMAAISLWLSVAGAASDPIIPAPPQLAASAYILMDARTGKILVDHNSGQRLPPASLTKIMTSYVSAFELQKGTISLSDEVPISVKAWRMKGSLMFIQEGTKVRLEDILRGIIIQSGNDASVAIAEHIAGSEDSFADLMNQHALRLGMFDTNFVNSTGWPHEDHYTSARDLAKLTGVLIERFPEHYQIYSEKTFAYNEISQRNRNKLLFRDKTADGVKTGHTEAAGYCLVASALRNGMRLITVVMGASSESARATESQKLLTYGFRYYETVGLYTGDESLRKVRVWGGKHSSINLGLAEDVVVTIARGARDNLTANLEIDSEIHAPLKKGQELGSLTVTVGSNEPVKRPLVALNSVEEVGFFSRLWDTINLFFLKIFGGDPLRIE